MLPDARAVIFDLDDTLYPFRRFRASGFLSVARWIEARFGLDARLAFRAMMRATRTVDRGREVQACFDRYDLPASAVHDALDVLRHHTPRLRMPRPTAQMLVRLRDEGWRIGVVTNGQPSIQARKVAALQIQSHVDAVIYAMACGRGIGKPEAAPFQVACRQLRVRPSDAVFVGDDERCDVSGARAAGMFAIRCATWVPLDGPTAAHAVTTRLSSVPDVARMLLEEALNRHAA